MVSDSERPGSGGSGGEVHCFSARLFGVRCTYWKITLMVNFLAIFHQTLFLFCVEN